MLTLAASLPLKAKQKFISTVFRIWILEADTYLPILDAGLPTYGMLVKVT